MRKRPALSFALLITIFVAIVGSCAMIDRTVFQKENKGISATMQTKPDKPEPESKHEPEPELELEPELEPEPEIDIAVVQWLLLPEVPDGESFSADLPEPIISKTLADISEKPAEIEQPEASLLISLSIAEEIRLTILPDILPEPDLSSNNELSGTARTEDTIPDIVTTPKKQAIATPGKNVASTETIHTDKVATASSTNIPSAAVEAAPVKESSSSFIRDSQPESDISSESDSAVDLSNYKAAEDRPIREIAARVKDEISVVFDGTGWIYLGGELNATGLVYKSRELDQGNTTFVFRAAKLGTYELNFQKQDSYNGTFAYDALRVLVLSDQDFVSHLQNNENIVNVADRFDENGHTESNQNNDITKDNVIELLRDAVNGKSAGRIPALVAFFLEVISDSSSDIVLEIAANLEKEGFGEEAAGVYEKFLMEHPRFWGNDEVCYNLGRLFETSLDFRDEKKALVYYTRIVDEYPASIFWEKANDRIRYLKRHFLNIR
jgi:hypothetical protein